MLMRFDPFAELDRINQELLGARRSVMPVDAYRQGDKFLLIFDLPGVDPESIDITVEKDTLSVSAERSWTPAEDVTVIAQERPQGKFVRRFFLGESLDTEKIEAGYDHGVLTVVIPVAEEAKPKKITVGSSDKALTL